MKLKREIIPYIFADDLTIIDPVFKQKIVDFILKETGSKTPEGFKIKLVEPISFFPFDEMEQVDYIASIDCDVRYSKDNPAFTYENRIYVTIDLQEDGECSLDWEWEEQLVEEKDVVKTGFFKDLDNKFVFDKDAKTPEGDGEDGVSDELSQDSADEIEKLLWKNAKIKGNEYSISSEHWKELIKRIRNEIKKKR